MNYVIIDGNPKSEGLCYSILEKLVAGGKDANANIEIIKADFGRCKVCNDGWGICRSTRRCAFDNDGFGAAMDSLSNADVVAFITPVYWHEVAEGLKAFIDRLRRCVRGEDGVLAGKSILLIASAGGTGNGLVNCMNQMEQFCRHTQMKVFDFIMINRWNSDYMGQAAYEASKAIAEGRQPGVTI